VSGERVLLVACGIFAAEYDLLEPRLRDRFEARFLDSMLHMRPALLSEHLAEVLAGAGDRPRVLLYGDCCPAMEEFSTAPGACRVRGVNCVEIAMGRERYRELRREGAFFFMPEWMARWEELFEREFGFFTPGLAADFMRDSARSLVYVDTGARAVPEVEFEKVRAGLGLQVRVEGVGIGGLARSLEDALAELDAKRRGRFRGREGAMPEDKAAGLRLGGEARAFEFLYSDLVERIMALADDPPRCVDFIAAELRSIVGARTAIIFECPFLVGGERHKPVAVHPERRRDLADDPRVEGLAVVAHELSCATIVEPKDATEAGSLLEQAGLGASLILPLLYGTSRVGVILLLDLIDPTNESSLMSTLDSLSSVLALILRNAWLYSNLEKEVSSRTAELEAKKDELEASLREKEVLLKEIHHRVKNNLQIVTSLLYLKGGMARDEETRQLFEDVQSRVAAIALVHEELYRSEDLARIDMSEYIENLVMRILEAGDAVVDVAFDLDPVRLSPEEAVPCGLIVNELVMNAFKYAFKGRSAGKLRIAMRDSSASLVVEVADDGPGLRGAFSMPAPGHVGLSIVSNLAAQLHGTMESIEGEGARIRLTIRKDRRGKAD